MGFFTGMMHIPALLAVMAIAAEFLGGLGLIVGLLTRVAAFGIFCNMVVAVAMIHHKFGFFMNWAGTPKGEGFEFPPPGTGDYRLSDDSRCRRSFRGSPVVFPRKEKHPGQGAAPSGLI